MAAYPGPVITRYEIEPAVGVKGSQIVNLAKDLARALSLVSIRVVETIPGKNLMGLELPNPRRQVVKLSEILGSVIYNESHSLLTLGLGKDISGKPVVVDLARMPHLLVAGTTGSGKSVGINAMILSILYKADPSQVRMILIDPKMLELSVYEGIPHLLAPVVTDMREAGNALQWCVAEMDKRYRLLSKLGVRSLTSYNQKIADARAKGEFIANPFSLTPAEPEPLDTLPMIVVVIDELADLMMVSSKKVEELIARIAQKARASGMHLILATQRPSVDVITGLIKANIPARISYQVSSRVDSRTILDQMGSESLLGQGDMLYLAPGTGLPTRVHGAFVADAEVHRVVDMLKSRGAPQYVEGLLEAPDANGESGEARRGGRCLRKRGRSVIRPGGRDRAEESPRVDLAGAAAPAHRVQPGRAPAGRHGACRHGVGDAKQRQSRNFGAGARRLRIVDGECFACGADCLRLSLATHAHAAALDQLRSFLTQTNSARGDFVQRVSSSKARAGRQGAGGGQWAICFSASRQISLDLREAVRAVDRRRWAAAGVVRQGSEPGHDQETAGVAAVEPRIDPVRLERVRERVRGQRRRRARWPRMDRRKAAREGHDIRAHRDRLSRRLAASDAAGGWLRPDHAADVQQGRTQSEARCRRVSLYTAERRGRTRRQVVAALGLVDAARYVGLKEYPVCLREPGLNRIFDAIDAA